jgi:hypothetical protein
MQAMNQSNQRMIIIIIDWVVYVLQSQAIHIVPDGMSNAQLSDRNICTFCKSSKTVAFLIQWLLYTVCQMKEF